MDETKPIYWVTGSFRGRGCSVAAIRINKNQIWFNKMASELIKGKQRLILGYDDNYIYMKSAGNRDFGLAIHRTKRKQGIAPYAFVLSTKFVRESKIKTPVSIKLIVDGDMLVGEIPK